jgi:hypothetical protein
MRSTSDPVSGHRHIRSPDELTLSLRPSQSRMSWKLSDSACDPDVKWRGRAGHSASGLDKVVPHAVAATVSVKCGCEHSGQGDFVKLITNDKFCLTRTVWLRLSWPRARGLRHASAPLHLCDELTHCGGEDATATQLAGPAHRCTHGQRSAALGPGLSASPAMGGSAPTPAGGDAGAFDCVGDISCA